jgi:plasmid stabilization system protein ParE
MPVQLYVLSPPAARQLSNLVAEVAEYSGEERSERVEHLLYKAFATIAALPGVGHLRPDLVAGPIFFYYANPYMVLYRKDIPIEIIAIFHGARDIASLMLSESE